MAIELSNLEIHLHAYYKKLEHRLNQDIDIYIQPHPPSS